MPAFTSASCHVISGAAKEREKVIVGPGPGGGGVVFSTLSAVQGAEGVNE